MTELTPNDIKRWDLDAIRRVFEVANARAGTLQAGSGRICNTSAGCCRSGRVKPVRRSMMTWARSAPTSRTTARNPSGWTITPDWRIDVGDTWIGRDPIEFAAQRQMLQDDLTELKSRAHAADHELATTIRAAIGEVQLDEHGHQCARRGPAALSRRGNPGRRTVSDRVVVGVVS